MRTKNLREFYIQKFCFLQRINDAPEKQNIYVSFTKLNAVVSQEEETTLSIVNHIELEQI